jgi:diadenosine tetraphosphate (Ap4A) HIT family hydrolase
MSLTAIHRRVDACKAGRDPTLICRMSSGWAVMGDPQVLPGHCLLLSDPVVDHLHVLPAADQRRFLQDVGLLGQAVFEVTGAQRINHAIFGNVEPALHAHVIPRYPDEPPAMQKDNPWAYDWSQAPAFDQRRDDGLLVDIRRRVLELLRQDGYRGLD